MELTTTQVRAALLEVANGPHLDHITMMINNRRADLVEIVREIATHSAKRAKSLITVHVRGAMIDVDVSRYSPAVAPVIFAPVERCHPGEPAEVEYGAAYWNGIEVSELIQELSRDDELAEALIEASETARKEPPERPDYREAA